MINRAKTGQIGEEAACGYILNKGWRILKRNHQERADEIDIIAISNQRTLIFCEVKTLIKRWDPTVGLMPEDNLSALKLRKISRACQIFVGKHPELIDSDKGWQIDLFAVDLGLDNRVKEIRHYENI